MNITLKLCVIALSSWICSGFLSGKLCSRNGLYQSAPPGIIQVASKRNWNDRYQQLVVFYEDHGHSDVGDGFDQSLTEWVYRQRKEYRKYQRGAPSTLTPAKIDLLNQLKFVWDKNQQAWDERFDELLEFQKEFGHVNVPTKYKTLGQWVTKQRKEQREGRLDDLRAKRLNGVSFVWNVKDWVFQARLEQLREFKNKHGHLKVKMSDGELGPWFYSRRKEYLQWLEGGKTTLSNEHREALEEVGFGPGLKKRRSTFDKTELSWDDRYDQLILFKRIHGHVRVPSSYGTLGSWVQYQRSRRDKMLAGRQRLLDQAGFVWSYREWQWDQRFEELVGYKKKFGNTDVPMSQGELGEWVQWQRVSMENAFSWPSIIVVQKLTFAFLF